MKKYILIIVVGWSLSQGGVGGFSAEFDSIESCQIAARHVSSDVKDNMHAKVVSIGCYEK